MGGWAAEQLSGRLAAGGGGGRAAEQLAGRLAAGRGVRAGVGGVEGRGGTIPGQPSARAPVRPESGGQCWC